MTPHPARPMAMHDVADLHRHQRGEAMAATLLLWILRPGLPLCVWLAVTGGAA